MSLYIDHIIYLGLHHLDPSHKLSFRAPLLLLHSVLLRVRPVRTAEPCFSYRVTTDCSTWIVSWVDDL